MAKEFYDRLSDYFSSIGKVLRGEASTASIFPNSTDVGITRENIYAKVLKLHLPSSTNVLLGGFLFDLDGKESKQIDLMVINDNSIQFNFNNQSGDGKSFACIDGSLAVASIKSNLTGPELINALENIASLPDKRPLTNGMVNPLYRFSTYEDWPFKIIYATDGVKLDTCIKTLEDFYKDHSEIPLHKRPNIIHVSGKYYVFRNVKEWVMTSGKMIKIGDYTGESDNADSRAILMTILSIQLISQHSQHIAYRYNEIFDAALESL